MRGHAYYYAKAVAAFGFVLGCATLNTGARYFAMCLISTGTYAVNNIILGWVSATCSQNKEKKACSLAMVNCIAVASFIWTPYMWPSSDDPRYTMSSSAALSVATAIGAWGMRFWLVSENKKIRQSENESALFYAYCVDSDQDLRPSATSKLFQKLTTKVNCGSKAFFRLPVLSSFKLACPMPFF
ncbi:hypothetical protein FGRMN_1878 [Fusarium graminum]|nr:hypothetical protein FGRMN_1878 [Fusarium graminum]